MSIDKPKCRVNSTYKPIDIRWKRTFSSQTLPWTSWLKLALTTQEAGSVSIEARMWLLFFPDRDPSKSSKMAAWGDGNATKFGEFINFSWLVFTVNPPVKLEERLWHRGTKDGDHKWQLKSLSYFQYFKIAYLYSLTICWLICPRKNIYPELTMCQALCYVLQTEWNKNSRGIVLTQPVFSGSDSQPGVVCPAGDIWYHLQAFLAVTTEWTAGHLVGRDKDATQHSTRHRRAPTTNNYPVPNAKGEKWRSTGSDTEHY